MPHLNNTQCFQAQLLAEARLTSPSSLSAFANYSCPLLLSPRQTPPLVASPILLPARCRQPSRTRLGRSTSPPTGSVFISPHLCSHPARSTDRRRGHSRLPRGGFSKPDISAPFGMRRRGLAPPPTPYLARSVENVIISEPTPGACPHMVLKIRCFPSSRRCGSASPSR